MVGVVNPAKGTFVETQRGAAKNASFELLPGQPWPSNVPKPLPVKRKYVPAGVVAAAVVLSILFVALLLFATYCFLSKKRRRQKRRQTSQSMNREKIKASIKRLTPDTPDDRTFKQQRRQWPRASLEESEQGVDKSPIAPFPEPPPIQDHPYFNRFLAPMEETHTYRGI
jgi:hypothetical protein